MKKQDIFLIILLLSLVGLSIIFLFSDKNINCANLQNNSEKDNCFIELAIKTKDSSICSNVSGNFRSGATIECHKKVYIEMEDLTSCVNLYYFIDRQDCYKKIFEKTYNKYLCDNLDEASREECIISIN